MLIRTVRGGGGAAKREEDYAMFPELNEHLDRQLYASLVTTIDTRSLPWRVYKISAMLQENR